MATDKKLSAAEEDRITANQWERYVRARDNGHTEYMALAQRCDKFYLGDQWETADLAALGDRPALKLNMILTTVNAVLAEQSQRRVDVQFKPKKGGKQDIANVLNKVYEHISTNNKLDWIEQTVFADGLIMDGRGFFDVRVDFKKNLMGDVSIKALDPLDVLLDPDAKEQDPREWNEVFVARWSTLDDIEASYGKKCADRLMFIAENGMSYGIDSMEWKETRFGDTESSNLNTSAPLMPGADNGKNRLDVRNLKRLRVIERQYYKMQRVDYFVDPMTGDQREVPGSWDDKRAKKFAKNFGLSIISQMHKKVRWTVTCDKVVLHDDWSPYNHFTVVPFFAYFRRGKPFGMVRNLISPQELLNKSSSQELHVINTTANSGWIIESGSLTTLSPTQLEEHGSQTGIVVEFNKGATPPEKIMPNQIPTGLDRVSAKAAAAIKAISGVNDQMLNGSAKDQDLTNPLKMVQQNQGTIMAQVPLDNLTKTRHYLAEIILDLIQNFYTEERIIQITDDEDPLHPREPMVINEMTPEGEVVNDLTVGSYDVMLATVPARDTFNDVQFLEAMALKASGVMIPDDAIIGYSHLAQKAELAKRVRIMTGVEKSPEQQQIDAYINQLQIGLLEGQVGELNAKIQKLQSEAAVNIAKAQDTADVAPQLEIARITTERDTREKELQLRRELAQLSASARNEQTQTGAAVKMATTAMATAAKTQQAANKPKPATPSGAKKK